MDPQRQKPRSAWLSKAFGSFKGRKDVKIAQTALDAPDASAMSPILNSAVPYYGQIGASPEYLSTMIESKSQNMDDDIKLSISIDFGMTFSGVAYRSSRIFSGKVQQILHWPGTNDTFRKIPTCILYDDHGKVKAWGLEAKNASLSPDMWKCEWFKLYLEPKVLRSRSESDPRLPTLPPGKRPVDLITDFLNCLWEHSKEIIIKDMGTAADLNDADFCLTVPAAWDARGCNIMREAAIAAGLNGKASNRWRDHLKIIVEPEAAAVHCAHLTQLHKLKASQHFIICDGGGGTFDLASYRIVGRTQDLEIAEVCSRSGATCGSVFLDFRFRELVKSLLTDHPVHLDSASLRYFMHKFSERDKLMYEGESQDDQFFYFTCLNPNDADDPSVGLVNGDLAIPGNLLRREVFDPVVNEALQLIEDQLRRTDQVVDALMLVGGFSGSEYLFNRIKETFGSRINVIARPWDADTATLRGAAQYGRARRPLVSCVVAPCAYIMRVKLPAEQIDFMRRPQFISNNQAGIPICEHRVRYLVRKGAIIPRGAAIQSKFCKYSTNVSDRIFVATIYTSGVDTEMRYIDEGEATEICSWTIDLGNLAPFQRPRRPGECFYTDFDVGLEIDSAEVRGVLLYEGTEVDKVVFNFLS